jgi:hypothetical protein
MPDSRFIVAGSLLLLTFASGYWLSHSGKPISTVIFTIHKLIALSAVISTAAAIYHIREGVDLRALELSVIVATGVLFLALFATGAMLSIGKPASAVVLTIHRVAPYLAAGCAVATTYLLAAGKQL